MNTVNITGTMIEEPEIIYTSGERFYRSIVAIKRFSGVYDKIPVVFPEVLFHGDTGLINITGSLRSRKSAEQRKHYVFANTVQLGEEFYNKIEASGYVCRTPCYRKTPLGKEITDFCIVLQRSGGCLDYINCIAWGDMARFADGLEIGDKITVSGRIQSREYWKSEPGVFREIIELSISKIRKDTNEKIQIT